MVQHGSVQYSTQTVPTVFYLLIHDPAVRHGIAWNILVFADMYSCETDQDPGFSNTDKDPCSWLNFLKCL